ncbi:50S ribosomal protein L3 [Candidatus Woesearchaeota archaeon]|nr:50S ribosomal protein L3 [Candidatus Woesearchaeota archaeon]
MPSIRSPRKGSMQYWPRKRAKSEVARVRTWAVSKDVKMLGFAGYKAGMAHISIIDNSQSKNKGEKISIPVTIVECPPLRIVGARAYKKIEGTSLAAKEALVAPSKDLSRRLNLSKKKAALDELEKELDDLSDIMLIVETQPKKTGIGKKKPELFEMGVGGKTLADKLVYVKENMGKELKVSDVFDSGAVLDIKSITTGKGFQGPVKRFGVSIRGRKSEKTKRGPGSLGGWIAQGHSMYRIAHAGQMGYNRRTEYNKQILYISDKPEEINPAGGIVRYGTVRNQFILIKGSIGGPKKRLIRFNQAVRQKQTHYPSAPEVKQIIKN